MESTIIARDGIMLAVDDHTLPAPHARVVIVHGYAEHQGRYAALVDALSASNFECHLFDLRGHGRSGGLPAHVRRFDDYVDDLARVVSRVQDIAPAPLPLVLVAHSLGGLIALTFVQQVPAATTALVVSSPFLRPAFELSRRQKALAAIATHVAPTLSLDNTIDPAWLSRDAAVVAAYVDDPLVRRTTTPRWFTEVARAQDALLAGAAEIRVPLLMLLGDDDQIAEPSTSVDTFSRFGSTDKTLKRYAGLRHEVLNETTCLQVIHDLLDWLREHAVRPLAARHAP